MVAIYLRTDNEFTELHNVLILENLTINLAPSNVRYITPETDPEVFEKLRIVIPDNYVSTLFEVESGSVNKITPGKIILNRIKIILNPLCNPGPGYRMQTYNFSRDWTFTNMFRFNQFSHVNLKDFPEIGYSDFFPINKLALLFKPKINFKELESNAIMAFIDIDDKQTINIYESPNVEANLEILKKCEKTYLECSNKITSLSEQLAEFEATNKLIEFHGREVVLANKHLQAIRKENDASIADLHKQIVLIHMQQHKLENQYGIDGFENALKINIKILSITAHQKLQQKITQKKIDNEIQSKKFAELQAAELIEFNNKLAAELKILEDEFTEIKAVIYS